MAVKKQVKLIGREDAVEYMATRKTKATDLVKKREESLFEIVWFKICLVTGFLILGVRYAQCFVFRAYVSFPPVAAVVGTTVAWHYVDFITPLLQKFAALFLPVWNKIMRNENDGFIMNILIVQAVFIPCFFIYCLSVTINSGVVPLGLAFLYHVIRIGPYFNNFAYAYTLAHKEGHQYQRGMFKDPWNFYLGNVFNCWVGFFYGVLPCTFTYGHSVNHHRYNSDKDDVVSTWDMPRDDKINFVRFLPRWVSYHFNISSSYRFYIEGNYAVCFKLILGAMVYFSLLAAFWIKVGAIFTIVFLVYPLFEASLLLACIQWSWHAFLDPDHENSFAYSVTVFDGDVKTNILNEDYHVVHHQYPSAHWTEHPMLFENRKEEYSANFATCFRGTHAMELFFLCILREYEVLTDKFVDMSGTLTRDEIRELIITRVRHCSWGPCSNEVVYSDVAQKGKKGL